MGCKCIDILLVDEKSVNQSGTAVDGKEKGAQNCGCFISSHIGKLQKCTDSVRLSNRDQAGGCEGNGSRGGLVGPNSLAQRRRGTCLLESCTENGAIEDERGGMRVQSTYSNCSRANSGEGFVDGKRHF